MHLNNVAELLDPVVNLPIARVVRRRVDTQKEVLVGDLFPVFAWFRDENMTCFVIDAAVCCSVATGRERYGKTK